MVRQSTPEWESVEFALAMLLFAILLWAFASPIGKALGNDNLPDDSGWTISLPGFQSPAVVEIHVKGAAVLFLIIGCVLLVSHAGWLIRAIVGH